MSDARKGHAGTKGWKPLRPWLFPLAIACLYLAGFLFAPEKAAEAARRSGIILRQIAVPIGVAIAMMVLLNRFLSPALAAKYLGKQSGMRGVAFSSLAGILSMGPVYAWYPLMTTLKEKGVSTFHLANFISCRSIKPVLIPVLLAYFGWLYSVTFLLANFIAALFVAGVVSLVLSSRKSKGASGNSLNQ